MSAKKSAKSSPKKREFSLAEAFLTLDTEEEVLSFLKDLCTPAEIKAMQERWKVCQLLKQKAGSYQDIHNTTQVSITTIGRVARFLFNESHHGYTHALDRLNEDHPHHRG